MTAIIALLTTTILNSLGRIAAFLFSWAMVGFFGKMPPKRQYILAGISLMSILWTFFLLSVFKPEVTQFLFLLNKNLGQPRIKQVIERFSLIFVMILPFLIGFASLFVDNKLPETLGGKAQQVCKGWIIAPGFAIGIVLMMLTSVISIVSTYLLRLQTEHVPIKLKGDGYEIVLRDLRDALNKNGFPVRETEMSWYLKPPVLMMGFLAKSIVQGLVTPGARMLRGDDGLSIIVHPTDMVLTGPKRSATAARAVITQRVPFTEAYLTWEELSQKFEDKITALWRKWRDEPALGAAQREDYLKQIEKLKGDLHTQEIPFEQWEVVYRELLQLQDEVVSGRLQRGEAPETSAPEDAKTASGAATPDERKIPIDANNSGEEARGNHEPNARNLPPLLPELAIISLLIFLLARYRDCKTRL